jgi:hypothetical protein
MYETSLTAFAASAGRRQLLRLFFGAAAGGLSIAAGQAEAGKKEKRKNKIKKRKDQCKPGTRLASIEVPADGSSVSTPRLEDGREYRLLAVGSWRTNDRDRNDAYAAYFPLSRFDPILEFAGVRVGLAVDDGSPDIWGDYNPNHLYEIWVTGKGDGLSLHYTDPAPADNSGTLLVEVYCE